MEFKDRLRLLREEREMSATQLAVAFNKSESAIRMWETGKTKPDADTLIRLASFFDCTTDYLLGLDNAKNKEAFNEANKILNELTSMMSENAGIEDILHRLCDILRASQCLVAISPPGAKIPDVTTDGLNGAASSLAKSFFDTVMLVDRGDVDAGGFSAYVASLEDCLLAATSSVLILFVHLIGCVRVLATGEASPNDAVIIANIYDGFMTRAGLPEAKSALLSMIKRLKEGASNAPQINP